jgi:hypothetical protein
MHSIQNISEINKIDTQSRADAYIKRKRLISMSDYNLKSGFLSLLGKYIKKTKKNNKTKKTYKKNHWVFF